MSKKAGKTMDKSHEELIASRDELQWKLDGLRAGITSGERQLREQKLQIGEARSEVERFEEEMAASRYAVSISGPPSFQPSFDEANLNDQERERLTILRGNLTAAEEAAAKTVEELQALKGEEVALAAEVKTLNLSTSVEEILLFQEKLSSAERAVANIKELIAEQEKIILKANENLPTPEPLMNKREDILAGIALGDATEAELSEIDSQIAEAFKTAAEALERANEIAAPAEQALSGLKRRLEVAEEELLALRLREIEVLRRFLVTEAEKIGEDYLRSATDLVLRFRQLSALDKIMRSKGLSSIFEGAIELLLPVFSLESHRSVGSSYRDGELDMAVQAVSGNDLESDVKELEDKFAEMGIKL